MTSGEQKWGQQAEADKAREREELLAQLPKGLREKGDRVLTACEQSFGTWSYTVALMALGSALKRTGADEAECARAFDLVKTVLVFYRAAVQAEQAEFLLKEILPKVSDLHQLQSSLAYGHQVSMRKVAADLKRLQTLVELS